MKHTTQTAVILVLTQYAALGVSYTINFNDLPLGPSSLVGTPLPDDYGSTTGLKVSYEVSVPAGTSRLLLWNSGYSGLQKVGYTSDQSGWNSGKILLTPEPGYSVTLRAFQFGWHQDGGPSGDVTILVKGLGGLYTLYNSTQTTFNPNLTSSDRIEISWAGNHVFNAGIDNIRMTLNPSGIALRVGDHANSLMLLGLAGLGLIVLDDLRRR